MFGRKKAKLDPDYDEERLRAEIAEYKEVQAERKRRQDALRIVKKDIADNGMPKVKKKAKIYELGDEEEGEVKTLIEPRDKDGNTEVKVDTDGDGETDTILTYHKKKGLMTIEDLSEKEERDEAEKDYEPRKQPRENLGDTWESLINAGIDQKANEDRDLFYTPPREEKEVKPEKRRSQKIGMPKMRKPRQKRPRRKTKYRNAILN